MWRLVGNAFTWSSLNRFTLSPVKHFSYFGTVLIPLYAQILGAANSAQTGVTWVLFPHFIPADLTFEYVVVASYSIASFLVEILCPRKIRDYRSLPAYFGFIVGQTKNIREIGLIESLARDGGPPISMEAQLASSPLDEEDIAKIQELMGVGNKIGIYQRELLENFDRVWKNDNHRLPPFRVLIGTLYAVSLIGALIHLTYLTPRYVFGVTDFTDFFRKLFG